MPIFDLNVGTITAIFLIKYTYLHTYVHTYIATQAGKLPIYLMCLLKTLYGYVGIHTTNNNVQFIPVFQTGPNIKRKISGLVYARLYVTHSAVLPIPYPLTLK